MKAVNFVRTAPSALGESSDNDATVCAECGTMLRVDSGDFLVHGYHNPLSLDDLLVKHPHATYFIEIGTQNDSVIQENVYLGVRTHDILVVDRSRTPTIGCLVLVVCDGALTLCRYTEHEGRRFLVCGEKERKPKEITPDSDVQVWGVVSALSRRL